MSARGALALGLLLVVALAAFGAFLLNVPLAAVSVGAGVGALAVLWLTLRRRKKAKAPTPGRR